MKILALTCIGLLTLSGGQHEKNIAVANDYHEMSDARFDKLISHIEQQMDTLQHQIEADIDEMEKKSIETILYGRYGKVRKYKHHSEMKKLSDDSLRHTNLRGYSQI